jgi:putative N6-adenine-specific DNA methylase
MSTPVPETAERGTIIMNPPYGGRIGDPIRLRDTYAGMGVFLQQNKAAYDGFIFTGNPELAENSGLVAGHSKTFYSGRIECHLLENPTLQPEAEAQFLRRSAKR